MLDRDLRVNGEVWPRLGMIESMCREVGTTKAEFAGIVDAVEAAIGRWGKFARLAGVPKDLAAEAHAWHQRIRDSVNPGSAAAKRQDQRLRHRSRDLRAK